MSRPFMFMWPDRPMAKKLYEKNTREKGVGVFMPNGIPDSDADVFIITPQWRTLSEFNDIHPTLLKNLRIAIKKRGQSAIVVNLDHPTFQIIKIPYDPTQECELIFEARMIKRNR